MDDQVTAGARLRSASDQCPGTVQWVDTVHQCIGVAWDDGTSSTEPLGEDRGWELTGGTGHVCTRARCRCPNDGERLVYSHPCGEHACPRVGCPYEVGAGPGPGGGWEGALPPTPPPGVPGS